MSVFEAFVKATAAATMVTALFMLTQWADHINDQSKKETDDET